MLRCSRSRSMSATRCHVVSAVQEHHRLALAIARDLPVDVLPVAHVEHAGLEWLDLGIQVSHDHTLATAGCRGAHAARASGRLLEPEVARPLRGYRQPRPQVPLLGDWGW